MIVKLGARTAAASKWEPSGRETVPGFGNIALAYFPSWIVMIFPATIFTTLFSAISLNSSDLLFRFAFLIVITLSGGLPFAAVLGWTRDRKVGQYLLTTALRRWWRATMAGGIACWVAPWLLVGLTTSEQGISWIPGMSWQNDMLTWVSLLLALLSCGAGATILAWAQWRVMRDYVVAAGRLAIGFAIRLTLVMVIPCWIFLVFATGPYD